MKRQTTLAQQEYVSNLLKGKMTKINVYSRPSKESPPLTLNEKIKERLYYLDNCIYWVNEFLGGRITHAKLYEVAGHIADHAIKLQGTIVSEIAV